MTTAAERLLQLKKASTNFRDYIAFRHPEWDVPDFHEELIDILDKFERNELFHPETGNPVDNLMVTMPPRHSKSTYSTVEFPSYYIGRDPRRYIMTASYNSELATEFGREVRNIVNDTQFQQVFTNTALSKDATSASTWRTSGGGAFFGMGLGGSTSGRPANMLIVDDPYKNRPEAESPTTRRKVWEYYVSALRSRLQPTWDNQPAKQIIIHTRWHPDDLIGRIQELDEFKEGEWMHVDFAAIKNENTDHEEALWPERFPLKALHKMKRINPREFAALYQQQPFIEGGNILKPSWFQYYPEELKPTDFSTIIIPVDTAFKEKQGNDFSVAIPMGLTREGDIFLLDLDRGRYSYPTLKQRLIALNNVYRGRGLRALYVEDKASGQSILQDFRKQSGMSAIPYKNQDDKPTRAHAISPILQGGRIYLPEGAPWVDEFIREIEQFPNGSFDDQVDAFMIGVDVLSKTSISPDDAMEEGESLLEQYNTQRDIIMGNKHPAIKGSLNSKLKTGVTWKGWGM